jgi:hypothetical protein
MLVIGLYPKARRITEKIAKDTTIPSKYEKYLLGEKLRRYFSSKQRG